HEFFVDEDTVVVDVKQLFDLVGGIRGRWMDGDDIAVSGLVVSTEGNPNALAGTKIPYYSGRNGIVEEPIDVVFERDGGIGTGMPVLRRRRGVEMAEQVLHRGGHGSDLSS